MLYSTLCHATLKLAPSILDSKPDTLESLQATSGGGGHTGELPDRLLPLSIENTAVNSADYPCQKGVRTQEPVDSLICTLTASYPVQRLQWLIQLITPCPR